MNYYIMMIIITIDIITSSRRSHVLTWYCSNRCGDKKALEILDLQKD